MCVLIHKRPKDLISCGQGAEEEAFDFFNWFPDIPCVSEKLGGPFLRLGIPRERLSIPPGSCWGGKNTDWLVTWDCPLRTVSASWKSLESFIQLSSLCNSCILPVSAKIVSRSLVIQTHREQVAPFIHRQTTTDWTTNLRHENDKLVYGSLHLLAPGWTVVQRAPVLAGGFLDARFKSPRCGSRWAHNLWEGRTRQGCQGPH